MTSRGAWSSGHSHHRYVLVVYNSSDYEACLLHMQQWPV
jgi:hypothetical protein